MTTNTIDSTDVCKDCQTRTGDYELATHRGRCSSCFDRYDQAFKDDATEAFVNHVLAIAAADLPAAAALKRQYWSEHPSEYPVESDDTDCGICVRSADIGVWVSGNPIAYFNPTCPDHGDPVIQDNHALLPLAVIW